MSVTGWASLAITRSRSVRETSSVTSTTFPPVPVRSVRPTVAVVFSAGAPAGSGKAGCPAAAKQLLAVRIHWASTSEPVQARAVSPSPMSSFAVKAYEPSATASPTTACAGEVTVSAPAAATTANSAVPRTRREDLKDTRIPCWFRRGRADGYLVAWSSRSVWSRFSGSALSPTGAQAFLATSKDASVPVPATSMSTRSV